MKRIITAIMFLAAITGCKGNKYTGLERTDWAPDVKEAVNDFLELYHGSRDAYAVFDFDNTSAIFDVEEQLMAYQLETMSFALDPSGLRAAISTGLENREEAAGWISDITVAYTVLYDKYGPFSPEGLPEDKAEELHADPWWQEFASKMGLLYDKVGLWCSTETSYNWVLYWFSGMTEKEVYDLAYRSHSKYSKLETSSVRWSGPDGLDSKVGPVTFEWMCGVQVTENIKELWSALQSAGIDIWVCSASGIQQVLAAIDAFGLHDKCTGVLGMTLKKDLAGRYIPSYDYSGGCGFRPAAGGWKEGGLPMHAMPAGPGKVTAILNAIAPQYRNHGPLAGFMDSTGDFNFCTEFSSLKMVVCFNRANRKVTDGGGLIAEVAIHQRDNLGYDLKKANAAGDTMYLLQGRDENGLRTFRPSNLTLRYGESEERLFANADNEAQLTEMKGMSTAGAINRFSTLFLSNYPGYHSLSEKCTRTGQSDPVLRADPYIFHEDGTYYLYGTYSADGIAMMVSKDLKTWETPGDGAEWLALDKKDSFGEKWFWAPEVYRVGQKYVMFYSAEEHICMAESDSPLGPFKGDGSPIVDEPGIDCSMFIDDDGTPYIFWVRFDNGNVIWMARLTDDLKHIIPGSENFVLRPELPWETHITEGPFCIKHEGTYYLTYSGDDFRSKDYAIGYATATSPQGPWTKFEGNPILRRPAGLVGTGHHSFFKNASGGDRIVFHSHFSDTMVAPRRTLVSSYSFEDAGDGADRLVISPDWFPLVCADGDPSTEESRFIEAVAEYKRSGDGEAFRQAESLAGRMETMPARKELASALVQLYEMDGMFSRLAAAELMMKELKRNRKDISDLRRLYDRATCHPRLIMDDEAFADMKRQIEKGSNPALAKIHSLLMELTDSYGEKTFTKDYDESHKRILGVSRAALAFITNNAYAYRYTGDRKYLDAAAKAIDEVCSFDNWNPTHFLDVAEMAAGVSIGYDWLWKDLSPEIRAKAEKALAEYAIKESYDSGHAWFYGGTNNWNQVCNAGLTMAAIAVRDILGPESGRLITKAVANNRPVVEIIYSPDGNYSEGQMYWNYGTCFQAMLNTTLESALGADFGLSDVTGFDKTAEYKVFCNGASHKTFNYYDNTDTETSSGAMWYFASRFDRPDLLATELQLLEQGRTVMDNNREMAFIMAWAAKCKPEPDGGASYKHMYSSPKKNPVVIVRGDWSCSDDDYYLGLKGGSGSDPHAHLDAGNFVFDAFGERWAADYGMVDYARQEARLKTSGGDFWDMSQNSQRWDVIPLGNEWHNTLTVNGKRHSVKGNGTLLETIDEPGRQGGTMDLTSIFPDLTEAIRTATTDGHNLTVTDRLSSTTPVKVRWTMVTPASCEIDAEGVTLTSGGKKMHLTMSGAACTWSIRQSDEPVTKKFTVLDADFTIPAGTTVITTGLAR